VEEIAMRMRNCTILWVEQDESMLKEFSQILQAYDVDYQVVPTYGHLVEYVSHLDTRSAKRSYLCLLRENLYEADKAFLMREQEFSSVMVTYGPDYSVKETAYHVRSLVQMLPSVLLSTMANLLHSSKRDGMVPQPSVSVVSERELRVLIAEDNRINQKVLVRMLHRMGIERTHVVENGLQAVETEATQPFDVILMDMQMPVMDGVEACQKITTRSVEDVSHPIPKVVFVTAHVSAVFEQQCALAGACGFLPKPFNMGDIQKCFLRLRHMMEEDTLGTAPLKKTFWSASSLPMAKEGAFADSCSHDSMVVSGDD
jgi:CheY-like chemotaxis protein